MSVQPAWGLDSGFHCLPTPNCTRLTSAILELHCATCFPLPLPGSCDWTSSHPCLFASCLGKKHAAGGQGSTGCPPTCLPRAVADYTASFQPPPPSVSLPPLRILACQWPPTSSKAGEAPSKQQQQLQRFNLPPDQQQRVRRTPLCLCTPLSSWAHTKAPTLWLPRVLMAEKGGAGQCRGPHLGSILYMQRLYLTGCPQPMLHSHMAPPPGSYCPGLPFVSWALAVTTAAECEATGRGEVQCGATLSAPRGWGLATGLCTAPPTGAPAQPILPRMGSQAQPSSSLTSSSCSGGARPGTCGQGGTNLGLL